MTVPRSLTGDIDGSSPTSTRDEDASGRPGRGSSRAAEKVEVLLEALPWLEQFVGRTVVIKYGGHVMVDAELRQAFMQDVVFLHRVGLRPVIVHGGGPQISAMLTRLGVSTQFRAGLRVTTPEVMDVVRMVLTGDVQRQLVTALNARGALAVGLSGEDGGLFRARRRRERDADGPVDLGLVGDVVSVAPATVQDLLEARRIPVVSTVAPDLEDPEVTLNVNADAAAAALAVALEAEKLVILTDVEGLYANWPDRTSLVTRIGVSDLAALLPDLVAGMHPKMEACLQAVRAGVPRAHVVDGRVAHSMLLEIFTEVESLIVV